MPSIIELYRLKKSKDPVNLSVEIGHAGSAETTVYLDGIELDTFNGSFKTVLGPNDELFNKKLEIRSYVAKVIPGNHQSGINIQLTGGHEEKDFPMTDQSADNPVVFLATFYLIL